MAFREVVLTEEEQKGGGRPYKKLEAIGDSAVGFLVAVETQTKTFRIEEGPKTFKAYVLWGRLDGKVCEFEVTGSYDLDRKMAKALKPFDGSPDGGLGLQEGMGHLVRMKFSSTLNTGQTSPMKMFIVAADTEFKPERPLPASVTWAKQAAPRDADRKPPADDDIPF